MHNFITDSNFIYSLISPHEIQRESKLVICFFSSIIIICVRLMGDAFGHSTRILEKWNKLVCFCFVFIRFGLNIYAIRNHESSIYLQSLQAISSQKKLQRTFLASMRKSSIECVKNVMGCVYVYKCLLEFYLQFFVWFPDWKWNITKMNLFYKEAFQLWTSHFFLLDYASKNEIKTKQKHSIFKMQKPTKRTKKKLFFKEKSQSN